MIGRPLRRQEDDRLLRGRGRFGDDFSLPGQTYAAMVRSPHPHARIVAIDGDRARAMPGVLAVLTGADVAADGLGAIPHNPVPSNRYGCHVCEVEVDPETGAVHLVRYAAVDDVGRAINPLIVDGQTHGGIVQGLGQALGEACVVAADSGQTLTGSLMEYVLPRAVDVPCFTTRLNEVPSPTNPLGVKAGGEGGTTPAPAVIASAIADALALGVGDIPLPATPQAIWRAIHADPARSSA